MFDLYDTVLKDISFNFENGIAYLHRMFFREKCSLEELQKKEIPMYILSNSIFTGHSAVRLLDDFGISGFFSKLFSSADYRVRKPSPAFYRIVLDEISENNRGIKAEDILYVGNDYATDVMGAASMGLSTVWYNVNHLPNTNGLAIQGG